MLAAALAPSDNAVTSFLGYIEFLTKFRDNFRLIVGGDNVS